MGFFETRKKAKALAKKLIPKYESYNGTETFFNYSYKKGLFSGASVKSVIPSIITLEEMLFEEEKIERMTLPAVTPNSSLIIACTQERILSVWRFGSAQFEVRYDEVISISRPAILKPIKIETISGQSLDVGFQDINKDIIDPMLKFLQTKVSEFKKQKNTSDNSSNLNSDADEIEKLFKLKEKGIITDEEFKSKKKKILGL